jgi:ABC-type multidrug transport system ATPase subunit
VSAAAVLSIQELQKRYGRTPVLGGVSFDLERGAIVTLLGPNGAGKTTTFKCILGMTDFKGEISVAGQSVRRAGKLARMAVGYLPQTPGFADDDTCREALLFLAEIRGVDGGRIPALLERVNLGAQASTRVKELSGGMRQRLALAAALLSDPPLLLLDEPTANLDAQSRESLHELLVELRDEGRTILLSTHFVEHVADIADRVIYLQDGLVALDSTAAALRTAPTKNFSVHLNGTPPDELMQALRNAGIAERRVKPLRPSLHDAIEARITANKTEVER